MDLTHDEILEKLSNGEIRLFEIEKYTKTANEAADIRREFIENESGVKLEHISKYSIDMTDTAKKNIENPIGTVQIPVGVVGPLVVNCDDDEDINTYVPMATTEGALLASVNRGCSAIRKAGGCNVSILANQMTRAPVIKTKSTKDAAKLKRWINEHFNEIKKVAETTTSHGKLLKIDPIAIVGRYAYPRFVYDSGDSMGMNMVTIATEKALEFIEGENDIDVIALSGNFCVDKKPAAVNMIEGRGKSVVAEVVIPKEIVEKTLKTTTEEIVEVNYSKNLLGSAIAGSYGYNAHFANMVAALFIATGQDPAHVTEASLGITTAENDDGDLYFSVTLPDLPVATVGGGTRLETASESLNLIGAKGSGKVERFASIVAGIVLAGELSLIGALAAGHLASAHQKLGR
ncbi:MAG: hydroxymethylglutaryl-CoA reductase (NADPH) [Methanosphaera sp.]|uniref:hydroxymethylglutaryl-CoA reductase (NADPH) n=1 Tax=Methanosphaera sp. TaxID=2666342 RepID=UPI0025CE230A|nr:hydroxymethylglutaryl-CoA reductase (NADPH) [Methanosphaera sp.]MCI5867881.1 hydroxymethylglutaryl-CoA reductase (NADPH) [Methanosphaera sp.]MDD6534891.1 hydroxymethylglutaryl-CoA reductase (NADPH) [Methanosphaera sp.]MDY3955351.1 hydroxymethylglutaryl-CoA reductase (NADPH) [Methanosphaera sp.]